mmetsp:Transcript_18707/g.53989  ORF Transcript_18707/g.53989 Transcript_18707/m.53989 type:complete len:347 (-) Transcript_18707:1316-2356(-)
MKRVTYHWASVVLDPELVIPKEIILHQTLGRILIHGVHLGHKRGIAPLGPHTLLVQYRNQTHPSLDQFQNVGVILKRYLSQFDALEFVLGLYRTENVRREFLLKFFVRVVDAQLLVPVHLETLKPENIEQPNESVSSPPHPVPSLVVQLGPRRLVNLPHQPEECSGVYLLRERVPRISRLGLIQRHLEHLPPCLDGTFRQRLHDVVRFHPHQFGQSAELVVVLLNFDNGFLLVGGVGSERQISQLQHDADRSHQRQERLVFYSHDRQRLDSIIPSLSVGLTLDGIGIAVSHERKRLLIHIIVSQFVPNFLPFLRRSAQQLIKYMKCTFALFVSAHTTLLQQINLAE